MKKIISVLLCCVMLGALCACQHGGDYEKRTPVPQFDMMASYSFDDVDLKNDDGVSYYRQSLGRAGIMNGSALDYKAAVCRFFVSAEYIAKFLFTRADHTAKTQNLATP